MWNVGTRAPGRLAADIAAAPGRGAGPLLRGLLRFAIGAMLLLLAARLIAPALPGRTSFTIAETWTLFAGLAVELLVGDDLRRRRTS